MMPPVRSPLCLNSPQVLSKLIPLSLRLLEGVEQSIDNQCRAPVATKVSERG